MISSHLSCYLSIIYSYSSGCPLDPMMTFAFYNSSMNTEVAPQTQPRGTKSWTVGALEVSCCDHCRGCSVVSLSGSSEFLALSLFEVGSNSVNWASLFWSVHGISLQVSWIDVAPLEIGFDHVFIPQFWSTLVSFASLEFPVHQAFRYPTLLDSNHMSNPSKLGLDDDGLYAGGFSLIKDLQIGDVVLCLACLADSSVNFSVQGAITGYGTPQIFEMFYVGKWFVVNGDGGGGGW